jgi:hypothetical protein
MMDRVREFMRELGAASQSRPVRHSVVAPTVDVEFHPRRRFDYEGAVAISYGYNVKLAELPPQEDELDYQFAKLAGINQFEHADFRARISVEILEGPQSDSS